MYPEIGDGDDDGGDEGGDRGDGGSQTRCRLRIEGVGSEF